MIAGIMASTPYQVPYNFEETEYAVGYRASYSEAKVVRYYADGTPVPGARPTNLPVNKMFSNVAFSGTVPEGAPITIRYLTELIHPVDGTVLYTTKTLLDAGAENNAAITNTPDFSKFFLVVVNSTTSVRLKVYNFDAVARTLTAQPDVILGVSPALTGSPTAVTARWSPVRNRLVVQFSPGGGATTGFRTYTYNTTLTGSASLVSTTMTGEDRWYTNPEWSDDGQDFITVAREPINADTTGLAIYRLSATNVWSSIPAPQTNLYVDLSPGNRYLALSKPVPEGPYTQFLVAGAVGGRACHIVGKRRDTGSWEKTHEAILANNGTHVAPCSWSLKGYGLVSGIDSGMRLMDIDPATGKPKTTVTKSLSDLGVSTGFFVYGTTR